MPNKTLKLFLALVAICLLPLSVHAESRTVSLVAQDDASVSNTVSDPNGNATALLIDYISASDQQSISYLSFDLSTIPKDVVVTQAKLVLFASDVTSTTDIKIQLKDVQDVWSQSTMTWDTRRDTGLTLSNATIHAADSGEFITWPDDPTIQGTASDALTKMIKNNVRLAVSQFSCALVGPSTAPNYHFVFISSEGTIPENSRPRLDITYEQTGPKISGVVVSDITDSKATISWVTDSLSDSSVYYGTSAANTDQVASLTSTTTNHSITLQGLKPRTEYAYRVRSEDGEGFATSSDLQPLFNTLATPPPTNDPTDEKPVTDTVTKPATTTTDQTKQQAPAQKTVTKPVSTPATAASTGQPGELLLSDTANAVTQDKSPIDAVQKIAIKFLPFIGIIGFFMIIFRSSISGYAENNTPGFKAPAQPYQPPVSMPQPQVPPPPPMYANRQPVPQSPVYQPMPAPTQTQTPPAQAWYDAPPSRTPPPPYQGPQSPAPRPAVVRLTQPQTQNRSQVLDLKKK